MALDSGVRVLRFSGRWTMERLPELRFSEWIPSGGQLRLELQDAEAPDTSLAMTLTRIVEAADDAGVVSGLGSLPDSLRRLIELARAVPEQEAIRQEKPSLTAKVGKRILGGWRSFLVAVTFFGEVVIAIGRIARHPKTFRFRDFLELLGDCGFRAIPIVCLLAFLTGLILAFVGAVQLRIFGADIYVADLVGLAMSREMAALMTSMIMAGRSGAAFAARLGTMKVSEEIDALSTFGFHPVDMLALPRLLALTLMMPFLTLYADLMGYLGGALIGFAMLDISHTQYLVETQTIVTTWDIGIGLVKSAVFGFIIAACGCVQGLNCGSDAAAVGQATTRAVVMSVTLIVVADSIFAVICEILKI